MNVNAGHPAAKANDAAPARPRRPASRLAVPAWLLGPAGSQRLRAAQSLLAMVVYAVFAAVQEFEVAQGLIDRTQSILLSTVYLVGSAGFFVCIRSGLNLRVMSDPSLTFAQCLFGIAATCLSYAITGPARGAVMGIVLLILVFAMFALPPHRIRILGLFAFALLLGVMAWRVTVLPERYPIAVEATHLMFAMIIFASIAVLSLRMGAMRDRLHQQKAELSHALEQNLRLATLDELTGLVNRRHMGATLRSEIERQDRGGAPMTLVLIDIDLFKRINDVFGHAAGDTVLRRFAALALGSMRACDMISRWGGEEFLVLMPETNAEHARVAIDRLREAFAALTWPDIQAELQVTFSAGVATSVPLESIESVIERADQAMYGAKTSGRNRLCLASEPEATRSEVASAG